MIQEFERYLVSNKGYSRNTAVSYGKDLRHFAGWVKVNCTDARWSAITREDIQEYISTLSETGKRASTINRHLESIRQCYNYMMVQGMMDANPARYISSHKVPKTIPNTINQEELETALAHSHGTLRVMLLILCKTGIRVQELLDIEQCDIDQNNGRIKIHGKGQKERFVYMQARYMAEVVDYCKGRPARIFGGIEQRAVRSAVYQHLSRYCRAKQLSPHAIRHTIATSMASQGCNVTTLATILGHESIKTTQKYVDLGASQVRQQMLQFIN